MRQFLVILAISGLLAFSAYAAHDSFRPKHWDNWQVMKQTHRSAPVTVFIALKQRNLDVLEKLFWEVSDPKHENYGNFLTTDEINDLVGPSAFDRKMVLNWVNNFAGVIEVVDYVDSLKVVAKAGAIEKMFSVRIHEYQHTQSGQKVNRIHGSIIRLPHLMKDKIEFVTGLTDFPRIRRDKKTSMVHTDKMEDGQIGSVFPGTLQNTYNIPKDLTVTNKNTTQSVFEFAGITGPLFSDVSSFAQMTNSAFTNVSHIVGSYIQGGSNGESTLDEEYISVIAQGAVNWYWTVDDGWAYEMALELMNQNDAPLVNSVSYGWPEEESCQSSITQAKCRNNDVQSYVARSNVEFQKVGLKGLTMIICTQDEGAPSEQNMECQLDDTHPVWAIFPGSSPYVTAVSATTIDAPPTQESDLPDICNGQSCTMGGANTEVPCSVNNTGYQWTTGGGFSSYGERPDYQKKVVAEYINSGAEIPPSNLYPNQNRGYPDVSAAGDRILIVQDGSVMATAGTSASTPIFAGIVTLLTDARLNNGKKPFGFINPLLYQMSAEHPAAFNDVTKGDNKCTAGQTCCQYGYGATEGWDAVSGLGTPNFGEMLNYINAHVE